MGGVFEGEAVRDKEFTRRDMAAIGLILAFAVLFLLWVRP